MLTSNRVKTRRDIWRMKRESKKAEKEMRKKRIIVPPLPLLKEYLTYLKIRENSLAEIRKYHLDYLERKKWADEIFDFIERDLGKAGFSKVR